MADRGRWARRVAFGAALCAVSACVWSGATLAGGILGYLDPSTGVFRIAPALRMQAATPAAVSEGKIVVSFTINIVSAIPVASPITCTVTANVYLAANPYSPITESSSTVATRSGASATCRVTIPFLWSGFGSSDQANIWSQISASSGSPAMSRDSQQPVANIRIPATGTTTSFTIGATI